MTPSELAKVRAALECAEFELQPIPAECVTSVRIREAIAILDREAGRKTRTRWRVEYRDGSGEWRAPTNPVMLRTFSTHEEAQAVVAVWTVPGRILEVTESWEEPKA